jgi:hypothetical protein
VRMPQGWLRRALLMAPEVVAFVLFAMRLAVDFVHLAVRSNVMAQRSVAGGEV